MTRPALWIALWTLLGALGAGRASAAPSMADIRKTAPADAWRPTGPANTLYLDLPKGRVFIELGPGFAPPHVENIKRLARARFFDGLSVVRVQDNYVAQWGDADAKRPSGGGKSRSFKARSAIDFGGAEIVLLRQGFGGHPASTVKAGPVLRSA